MVTNEQHETSVVVERGKHRPSCTLCGVFGPRCDSESDAALIAERHADVGGFERGAALVSVLVTIATLLVLVVVLTAMLVTGPADLRPAGDRMHDSDQPVP